MSELKFACPVCGQHITCDSSSSGSPMPCPTCFRQLVVPRATVPGAAGLVVHASEVQTRVVPLPGSSGAEAGRVATRKPFPWAALALGVVVCAAAAAGYVFRERFLSVLPEAARIKTNLLAAVGKPAVPVAPPPGVVTNSLLNLADAKIPETPVAGQINGQSFAVQRATIRGGMLILWQGPKWPPEFGMAVDFFAKQAEELAGKTIIIEAAQTNAPRLMVRWKDEQGQPVTLDFREGYALRVEFGSLADSRLPGRIYLAAPDEGKSHIAGTFEADIHKLPPPKPKPRP